MSESDFEKEFVQAFEREVKTYLPEIMEKMEAANLLINEAVAISNKHGIPFRHDGHVSMSYIPNLFRTKYLEKWNDVCNSNEDLDIDLIHDMVNELTDASISRYNGWQLSQNC